MTLLLGRRDGASVITAGGPALGRDAFETVREAFAFIPSDDAVVLDLSDLERIEPCVAEQLTEMLVTEGAHREAVVVASSDEVRLQLVLCGLDAAIPLVHRHVDAVKVLRQRMGVHVVAA